MFKRLSTIYKKNKNVKNSKLSILIIEENLDDLNEFSRIIQKIGYLTLTANNFSLALEMAFNNIPHLILLDLEISENRGLDICKELKSDERTQNIPIIVITNKNTPKIILDSFESEADNFLTKPISPKILISQIQSILNER